ncbi:MAG: diphthine--ammonia ligase [Chloroflexi bacterium]|nr:MAG: diphthine--ammonia ligase [Chloroflexota bacterium]MBL1193364.1 diphthine--ammonia ligase [Chloroflexota bacterium]NOH10656.1 diphthine--ammonia ligase [Chloroflexota bacterium]
MKTPLWLSWSGGKDSSLALHALQQSEEFEVTGLLTTVTAVYERISMHGVRRELLDQQVEAIALPLIEVLIPQKSSNEVYAEAMRKAMLDAKSQGIQHIAFGDLFLEDVRDYRIENLNKVDMQAIFPIWGRDTTELAEEFIAQGFKTILVSVDAEQIDASFAGREFDGAMLNDLPESADPCGENGEFHTFVYDGPIFTQPIAVKKGEVVLREEHFYYCDLLPSDA